MVLSPLTPKLRQGQANHFLRFSKEKIPYGVQRYIGETERLYGVLDKRLADRDFVAGPGRGRYSIADMSMIGWVNLAHFTAIDLEGQFPNVKRWFDSIVARPAVQRGMTVPSTAIFGNAAFAKRLADGEEGLREREDDVKKLVEVSKSVYDYKYSSP